MKRVSFIYTAILLVSISILPAHSFKEGIPNIEGYQTLVGDFHIHTIFSDGMVWPTIRVDEAARDGLDVIAITDHIDYLPHKNYIIQDKNASYRIAAKRGKKKNILVIPGLEFTKWMPPGHFNALFIEDANKMINPDFLTSMQEAIDQNAFIIWNHPGWRVHQPDGVVRWYDIHEKLDRLGWIHGIEYANHHDDYPKVIEIAQERNYTVFANSDIHKIVSEEYFDEPGHRPVTFVFAEKRTLSSVREALDAGRTLGYFDHTLVGSQNMAKAFVSASVNGRRSDNEFILENTSQIPFWIRICGCKEARKLDAFESLSFPDADKITIRFDNVIISRRDNLRLTF